MRALFIVTILLGSMPALAQFTRPSRIEAAAQAISAIKDAQGCGALKAIVETEELDGQFTENSVSYLTITFVNPYGQENVMYSKGDIKVVYSGKIGHQQESISFELDQLREPKGGVHSGTAAEIIHDGKGNLIDLRIQRSTGYLNGKTEVEWSSNCKKKN